MYILSVRDQLIPRLHSLLYMYDTHGGKKIYLEKRGACWGLLACNLPLGLVRPVHTSSSLVPALESAAALWVLNKGSCCLGWGEAELGRNEEQFGAPGGYAERTERVKIHSLTQCDPLGPRSSLPSIMSGWR